MKVLSFKVFASKGKRKTLFNAYTMWCNPAWPGFVGEFTGRGSTRVEAKRDAINQARRYLELKQQDYAFAVDALRETEK